MTKEQLTFYLENNGGLCPYCKSVNIEADRLSADGLIASCTVRCYECEKSWIDVYTLTNTIEEEN